MEASNLEGLRAAALEHVRALRKTSSRRSWCAGGVLVLVFSAAVLGFNVPRTGFQGDEAGWIPASLRTAELAVTRNRNAEDWSDSTLDLFGGINPPAGKYMIGLPLLAWKQVYYPDLAQTRVYNWNESVEYNIINDRVPPVPLLYAARAICAFYGVLTCLLVFALTTLALRATAGVLAGGLLAGNWVFVQSATSAMTDASYLLLLAAGALSLAGVFSARTLRQQLAWSVACGAAAGLAFSVKVTGLVVLAAGLLAVIALKWRFDPLPRRAHIAALACFVAVAFFLPVSIYPLFWPDPGRFDARALAAELRNLPGTNPDAPALAEFWEDLSDPNYARDVVHAHYPQLANLLRPLEMPLMFFRWNRLLRKIAVERQDRFGEIAPSIPTITSNIATRYGTLPGNAIFLCAGIASLSALTWTSRPKPRTAALLLLCFGVNVLFLFAFLTSPYNRYFLPAILSAQPIAAAGLFVLLRPMALSIRPGFAFLRDALLADGENEGGETKPT